MKKILLFVLLLSLTINAQVLNQPANWPNTNWTITGSYDTSAAVFTDNPTVSSFFSYDEDEAGSGSNNNIAAESPVINLTNAFNAGEIWISVTSTYVLSVFGNETLTLQYWDADLSSWVNWLNPINTNTPGAPNSNFCSATPAAFDSGILNISGFSSNQLNGFRYRILYDDNGSWGWGFCFSSPAISSAAAPPCPNVTNLTVTNINVTSANIFWSPGSDETSWEIAIQNAGTGIPIGNGITTTSNNPYPATNLNANTMYEVYVRGNCTNGDMSNWAGPVNFTTLVDSRTVFVQQDISVSGYDLAVVDMNGDYLDDIVGVSTTSVNIHQQNGSGFDEMTISTDQADHLPTWSLSAADFDGNGKTDLLYGGGGGVTLMKANNDGTFFTEQSTSEFVFSQRSNFIDINNDGHLDAFVCHDVEPNVYFINDGLGNFTYYQTSVTTGSMYDLGNYPSGGDYGSIWIDYDNDRDMDLFISKCGGEEARRTNQMHTNTNGVYSENAAALNLDDPMQTWSSAWGDFDNDGDMDVFVGASSGAHKLMRNNGAPNYTFTDVTSGSGISAPTGWESTCYDFDNDGFLDIVSNGSIMYGKGDLTFEDADTSQLNYKNGSFGDLNDDGFIDAYYADKIYMNSPNANEWVKIVTVGTLSNKNGIGARVEVHTASGVRIRDVRSGEGFEFMSSLNTHVGLGLDSIIDKIVIYWPSGTIDTIMDPATKTTHVVVEGSVLFIEDESLSDLIIYPNPTASVINIESQSDLSNKIVTIFDTHGKRVFNEKLESLTIDVSSLRTGAYILRLESEGKITIRKFIKQ
ncbi:MAG: T9SS type A sorting domain-containing protein [Winogradskyella sp.]|nr:T9SS type A sorting domain-containing protein [Winogradskyella sp.]